MHVNLSAIIRNWQRLRTEHGGGQTGAVVKADAYGLGAAEVSQALYGAGCRIFFVATFAEAMALRPALPQLDASIYVFQGAFNSELPDYAAHRIHPIINHAGQLEAWLDWQRSDTPQPPQPALHIDTAMQRLGFNPSEALQPELVERMVACQPSMLMTHYACASDLAHPLNAEQYHAAQAVAELMPDIPTSYANSAGHFLDSAMHGQITRPGCALYGINPCETADTVMEPVVELQAPILQMREIAHDATLGYGATIAVRAGQRIATVAIGYADGIHRIASNQLYGYIGEYRVPLLGRVTMDMLCFDVSAVPKPYLEQQGRLTLMNRHQTVDDLARIYHTIGYEVLTSLGTRIRRSYSIFE